jgi:hypothetical protein
MHAQDPMQERACIEMRKLVQVDESEFERTHPRVVNLFP